MQPISKSMSLTTKAGTRMTVDRPTRVVNNTDSLQSLRHNSDSYFTFRVELCSLSNSGMTNIYATE